MLPKILNWTKKVYGAVKKGRTITRPQALVKQCGLRGL